MVIPPSTRLVLKDPSCQQDSCYRRDVPQVSDSVSVSASVAVYGVWLWQPLLIAFLTSDPLGLVECFPMLLLTLGSCLFSLMFSRHLASV